MSFSTDLIVNNNNNKIFTFSYLFFILFYSGWITHTVQAYRGYITYDTRDRVIS